MTDYRRLQDKPYLGAWDLPEDKDVVVVIERVEQGEVSNGTKTTKKGIVFFRGKKKGMVLNATNGKTIMGMYGRHVEAWSGKPIALYVTTTRAADGGTTDCIRVRPTAPKMAPEQAQDDAAKPTAEGPADAA